MPEPTRTVILALEVANDLTRDELHEQLCLVLHEGGSSMLLSESILNIQVVGDIEVTDNG